MKRFNASDVEDIAELYSEDAINRQIPQEIVRGKDAIGASFRPDFLAAEMTRIPEVKH